MFYSEFVRSSSRAQCDIMSHRTWHLRFLTHSSLMLFARGFLCCCDRDGVLVCAQLCSVHFVQTPTLCCTIAKKKGLQALLCKNGVWREKKITVKTAQDSKLELKLWNSSREIAKINWIFWFPSHRHVPGQKKSFRLSAVTTQNFVLRAYIWVANMHSHTHNTHTHTQCKPTVH